MKALISLIFVLLAIGAHAQVLGIDFGTEFWKAALISPGKNLVIVENSRSDRKTLNSIAFHEGLRFFEDDAKNKRIKKPSLTYTYLNKLLASLDDEVPLEGFDFQGETYVFEAEDKKMTLEQVVGMILGNIKKHASHQAETDIKDVVLTVPANWGFKAKMSLVNAAHIADFSVLGLINENSAAAIHFAITRNDTDPLNIMFFNLGSHNLQISIMKMYGYYDETKNKTIQGVEALGHFVKSNIGGIEVDHRISHYLAEEFKKKHKLDPIKNSKSFTKLLIRSSEVKQTLSANKDTQVYVEGLIDGIDLNLPINRKIIDELEAFTQFQGYLDQALKNAKLDKTDISSVELIGGATRIPAVNLAVKQYFPDIEVGSHINGDQAMAFGSALRAANLSLTFRVKQLYFNDPMNLQTKLVVSTTDKGVILQQKLFELNSHHGAKKTVRIPENKEDIKLTIYVGDDIVKQFTTKSLNNWQQRYKDQNVTGQPDVIVDFMMSSIHIAEIKDIYLNVTLNVTEVKQKIEYVDEEVEVEVKEGKKSKKSKKEASTAQQEEVNKEAENKENQQQEQKQSESQQGKQTKESEQKKESEEGKQNKQNKQGKQTKESEEGKQNKESQQGEQNKKSDQGQEKEQPKAKKTKKITKTKTVKNLVETHQIQSKRHIVSFQQTFSKYRKYTKEQVQDFTVIINQFEAYEKEIKEKSKIRNDLESTLYSLKDSFDDEGLKTFSKKEEVENLKKVVLQELEWMDQNAWTASKTDFQQHFKTLTSSYEPMYNRSQEYRNREKAYNQSHSYFSIVYRKTIELNVTHPWLHKQIQRLLKKVNQTVEQINLKLKKQIDIPLNQDPVIYNHEMISKAEKLRDEYYVIRLIPRPKAEKKEQPIKQSKKQEEKSQPTEEQSEQEPQSDNEQNQDEELNENEQDSQGDNNKNKEDL